MQQFLETTQLDGIHLLGATLSAIVLSVRFLDPTSHIFGGDQPLYPPIVSIMIYADHGDSGGKPIARRESGVVFAYDVGLQASGWSSRCDEKPHPLSWSRLSQGDNIYHPSNDGGSRYTKSDVENAQSVRQVDLTVPRATDHRVKG
ncbi:hypothetical protein KEM48_006604 [Puccinia striiformis f. sp. tritici PST-130]|nr:hypothetical protein KEM48_006604 [Puccinia striiformis f. sp. tritici PST-130]